MRSVDRSGGEYGKEKIVKKQKKGQATPGQKGKVRSSTGKQYFLVQ